MAEAEPIRAQLRFQSDWFGLSLWLLTTVAVSLTRFKLDLIPMLFLFGPLVIVQLGLEVEGRAAAWPWDMLRALGAALVVVALLFPAGWQAAGLALPWLAYCLWVAFPAVAKLWKLRLPSLAETCFLMGRLYLPVGGMGLLLSRLGATPLGFGEPIVLLTAVHFHFAGFATAVMAGAAVRAWEKHKGPLPLAVKAMIAVVVVSPGLLAIGFLISPLLQMIFALLLATGLLVFAVMLAILAPHLKALFPQLLLGVATATLVFAMAFVGVYAIGEYTERYWVLIPQMARWHGVANAFGFSFCGLLAWKLAAAQEARS